MKLLAFSGKKQSGKDSCAKFLAANAAEIFEKKKEWVHEFVGGALDQINYVEKTLPVSVKTYWFGGPMKEFAKSFGVEHRKVWGSDADKNEPIHICWEDLPHYLKLPEPRPTGYMTGRQFLQQIGEEMFLAMDPQYWVRQFEATVRADEGKVDIGLVADPRKPEQIDCIHRLGGKVIRLLRDPYEGKDRHISEIALDPPGYDQNNFDAIIDNRNLDLLATRVEVYHTLVDWGWAPLKKHLPLDWLGDAA